ncbi:MAG: hypothetical protein GXP48_08165 [Acidobacteria bacterium]|nr:hypothetical protein [Acidobacteriota bacterium]
MEDRGALVALVERMGSARVVLYGDLVLDRFILGTPKRISREAPVIILRYEGQRDIPGGGANALANLAALDVDVVPVAPIGADENGRALTDLLRSRNIDTSRLVSVPGFRTPTKVRILGGGASSLKHQMARYDIEDTLSSDGTWSRTLEEALFDACGNAQALAISDYGYGAVSPDVTARIRQRGATPRWITLDSRFRLGSFDGIDAATPNLQELEAWTGQRLQSDAEIAAAGEELRNRLHARFVLVTRGNKGMTLALEGPRSAQIPVFGTDEVADVTGAGDTVLAVLTAALAAGGTPHEAAMLANIAGGLVVMKLGTATVSRDELLRALVGPSYPPRAR